MSYLVPLPVAVPLLAAAVLLATQTLIGRQVRDLLSVLTAAATAVICIILALRSCDSIIVYWFGGWRPHDGIALGISFAIDPIGAGLAALSALLVTAALVFSYRYFEQVGALFPMLMLTFTAAMAGFCLTGDLFNLFVFFELMGVAAYALTAYKIEEEPALMGSFNFAVSNSLGAFLVLIAIAMLYGRTGASNLAQIGRTLAGQPADGLVITALALITVGLGVKAALVPLHFWLGDAHAVAPTPVCVLLSGTMVELGLYAIARIYWTVFSGAVGLHMSTVREVWLGFAALTALLGAVMCFAERHLKRLLAFSTISHVGMFFIGIALLTPLGLAGAALDVLGHGFVKGALFLVAGILLSRFRSVDANRLQGRGKSFPWLGALFTLGGLGLAGLPPFATCLGKGIMERSAHTSGCLWVGPLFIFCSALTGGAVLRSAGQVFLGIGPAQDTDASTPETQERETTKGFHRTPWVMIAPVAALLGLALWAGLAPALQRKAIHASGRFVDRKSYAAVVLDGDRGGLGQNVSSESEQAHSSMGATNGLISAFGAIAIASLALYPAVLPLSLRKLANRFGEPPMKLLRSVHSGNVADYVAWIVVGAAAMGLLMAVLGHVAWSRGGS